jgi:hypothetical protein
VQGAQPRLNVGSDARAQGDELALQPGLEGWGAIVVEHADVVEDLDGPLDAELITAQNGEQFGEADLVTVSMARQQNDQCPVDVTSVIAGRITATWSDTPGAPDTSNLILVCIAAGSARGSSRFGAGRAHATELRFSLATGRTHGVADARGVGPEA